MSERFDPQPPYLWPDTRYLWGEYTYLTPVPFQSILDAARSVFGVVADVDEHGVEWLKDLTDRLPDLSSKLIIIVYPACRTRRRDLQMLTELEQACGERVSFRLLIWDLATGAPPNALCSVGRENGQVLLCHGSSSNFGLGLAPVPHVNLVFRPDPALLETWRNWFDALWPVGIELNSQTINIPALVPPPGTTEAAALWQAYLEQCRNQAEARQTDDVQAALTPEADRSQSPTEALGLPKPDAVAERVARLYGAGAVVTIDKASRIPPLDAPIKPEWFGVESFRQMGAVQRRVAYRISALDEKQLRKLESKRKMTRSLLDQMSYSMGDGLRWMPAAVRPLFEQELERADKETKALVAKTIGDNVDAYLSQQTKRIIADLDGMFQEFHPGEKMSVDIVELILVDIKGRLQRVVGEHFLPKVTYSPIAFEVGTEQTWVSRWGQALVLVQSVAKFAREHYTDLYLLRGLRVDEEALLRAMDVCNDQLYCQRGNQRELARTQLELLEDVLVSSLDGRTKCECIFDLVDGKSLATISAKLPQMESAHA